MNKKDHIQARRIEVKILCEISQARLFKYMSKIIAEQNGFVK